MRTDDESRRQFSEYFVARRDLVRRSAYLMCGDWHWADDLTQSAFVRLAAAWHRIEDQQALDAFMRTCLVRTYLAEGRRGWRRREHFYGDPPERVSPNDDAEAVTRRMLVEQALQQLPSRQRITLVCRYYQGLDVAETAAVMGCSEGTVKSQTARGLTALRAVIGDAEQPATTLAGRREAASD